ncbi:uncharacterized protein VICG_00980 [Vittaforma corneae ATCC 50505]|uniref:Crossover junction endonuclease MUS81 n=1 Tax=Vittaforma corneae (strain ATCC 50505) TaxID=993615 RepID=L2GM45_VITCO|nr:uncharacterized protein VICG_00980 [Vittaforma corneae ATCC 50505]ELA41963.1 hypothetical protein VICG_00980 [Vittaforma corneae ATCC 50505]
MASFKESIRQALKNIIQKQTKLGLNSRFVFGKILKGVNEAAALENWEDLKLLKFVGEKTLGRIKEETFEVRKASGQCSNKADLSNESQLMKKIEVSDDLYRYNVYNSHISQENMEHANKVNIYRNSSSGHDGQLKIEFPSDDSYVEYLKKTCKRYEQSDTNGNRDCTSHADISEDTLLNDTVWDVEGKIDCCDIQKGSIGNIVIGDTDMGDDDSDLSSELIILNENDLKNTQKITETTNTDLEKIFDSFSDLNLEEFKINKANLSNNVSSIDSSFINSSNTASSFGSSIMSNATMNNIRDNPNTLTNTRPLYDSIGFADNSRSLGQDPQRKRKYVPGYRTAAYAILKALYHYNGSHKHLIVLRATPYTDAEFDKSQRFSAFSSFKTLQKKGLIQIDSDSRCYLTQAGSELCSAMFTNDSISTVEDQNIQIVIDSREKKNNRDRAFFQGHFSSKGIPNQTRYLNVGDFIWLKNERVVDVIVERKQTSDFVSSISDGRFREQKNRLKNMGFTVFYLVENMKVEESRKNYVNRCLLEVRCMDL